MFKDKDYSFLSKILHHLALGSNFIPEMLHDVEFAILKNKLKLDNLKPHIFICGLPRSGTTILMRSLYETKKFASLTYRDMPFVLLPNLWSKVSNKIKSGPEKERIHDDKISINIDSPEALEEVFWRVKLQKNYIYSNKLITHTADEFTINEFKNFVSLILYKYKKELYLSKNNNNILRLESIIKSFPNCIVIIPFRDPLQQANSLLFQHKNFTAAQNENKFVKSYMSYLAHYEFGTIHRPYSFLRSNNENIDKNSLEYWLMQWINAYTYLSQEKFFNYKNIIYLNYEELCKNPEYIFKTLSKKININNLAFNEPHKLEISKKKLETNESSMILNAKDIFIKLTQQSKINFS